MGVSSRGFESQSASVTSKNDTKHIKLQDADHERDANQPNPPRAQYATYPANKQDKEEVACVGMNRNLKQSLQHGGVHYPAER
ncbi:uncharacterized protein TNCV_2369291 [Trichonephila clavipes]|nr:uncharacterized protein TNCV_2369291 [Trichonephila clavipes]